MEELSEQSSRDHPDPRRSTSAGWTMFVSPMARDDDGSLRRWVTILFAAVMCLLLIVCSNVARTPAGAVLGTAIRTVREASAGSQPFSNRPAASDGSSHCFRSAAAPSGCCWPSRYIVVVRIRTGRQAAIRGSGVLVRLAMSLVTGVVCGLYSAWSATRIPAADSLKAGGHQRTAGKRTWQQGLIVAQVALATTLLLCGGLLVQSLIRLLNVPLGFDPERPEHADHAAGFPLYDARSAGTFLQRPVGEAARIPGVENIRAVRFCRSVTARTSTLSKSRASRSLPGPALPSSTTCCPATSRLCAFRCCGQIFSGAGPARIGARRADR